MDLATLNGMNSTVFRSDQRVILEGKPLSLPPAMVCAFADVAAQLKAAGYWERGAHPDGQSIAFTWERIEREKGKPYEVWQMAATVQVFKSAEKE